jgi:hypothetical protein
MTPRIPQQKRNCIEYVTRDAVLRFESYKLPAKPLCVHHYKPSKQVKL